MSPWMSSFSNSSGVIFPAAAGYLSLLSSEISSSCIPYTPVISNIQSQTKANSTGNCIAKHVRLSERILHVTQDGAVRPWSWGSAGRISTRQQWTRFDTRFLSPRHDWLFCPGCYKRLVTLREFLGRDLSDGRSVELICTFGCRRCSGKSW